MPPLPIVPGVLRVRWQYQLGGTVNTGFHQFVRYGGSVPSLTQLNNMAASAHTHYAFYMPALFHPNAHLTGIQIQDLSDVTQPTGIWAGTEAGTRTGGPLPASTSMILAWKVQRRYRGGKPRAYIPAGTDTDLADAQHWTAAFLSAFQSAWESMWSLIYNDASWGSPFNFCSVSYFAGHTWQADQHGNYHYIPTRRTTPLIDNSVASVYTSLLGTQRRRLRPT